MPPRPKTLRSLFVETVLFISLFALVGHLSINFWERYVIQTELSKMKTSLHSLKETINHIGIAYTTLHEELQILAEIAERGSLKHYDDKLPPDKQDSKHRSIYAKELLGNLIHTAIGASEICYKPTDDKETQMTKNVTTVISAASVEDKNIGVTETLHKTVQYGPRADAVVDTDHKDADTITKYPQKSVSVGQRKDLKTFRSKYSNNIHRCHNNYCIDESRDEDDNYFSKF